MPRLISVALAYLPAVWLVVAATVLAVGWSPRPAAAAAWVVVAYWSVIALFADSFDLPGWTRRASPFVHTPRVPLDDIAVTPLLVLVLLAAALVGAGCAAVPPLSRSRFGAARRAAGRLDTLTAYYGGRPPVGQLLLAARPPPCSGRIWPVAPTGRVQTEMPIGPAWLHLDLRLVGWVTGSARSSSLKRKRTYPGVQMRVSAVWNL